MFKLKITMPTLNPHAPRQMNADVECGICGRGIPNRETCTLAITEHVPGTPKGTYHFVKLADHNHWCGPGFDPVGWATFVGGHCAKQLPKEYKMTYRKAMKAWAKHDHQNT